MGFLIKEFWLVIIKPEEFEKNKILETIKDKFDIEMSAEDHLIYNKRIHNLLFHYVHHEVPYDMFTGLFNTIKSYVKGEIIFYDEDEDEHCKILFNENDWKELESQMFYGFCAYNQFIKEYGKELPEDIKNRLNKWWLAKKV